MVRRLSNSSLSGPGSIHMASRRNLPDVQTELGQIAVMQPKAIRLALRLVQSHPTGAKPAVTLPTVCCWGQAKQLHSDDSDSDELPARLRSMTLTSQANVSSNPPPYQRTAPLSVPSGLLPVYQYSAPTEQRLTNLCSRSAWRKLHVKWMVDTQQAEMEMEMDNESGSTDVVEPPAVPGEIANPLHRAPRKAFTREELLMELLAAEHSEEEPNDGELEGSGDDFIEGRTLERPAKEFQAGMNITKPLVHGVSGALHRSYPTPELAHAAFDYAAARSWTRVIDPTGASHDRAIPYLPQPVFTVNIPSSMEPNPLHPGENIHDNKWYIVYKGICPGVYRSYLESQLNVKGISAATHESVAGTKDFAIAKYLQAVEDGDVAVISPSYTRYI
ncbi:hypothetical protein B0H14DRAFT_2568911 [Mycena olivaceomarginata]|nr:hypothetical protein B0H14DRAFT_2568911 [Mycena olivaceomarginata]